MAGLCLDSAMEVASLPFHHLPPFHLSRETRLPAMTSFLTQFALEGIYRSCSKRQTTIRTSYKPPQNGSCIPVQYSNLALCFLSSKEDTKKLYYSRLHDRNKSFRHITVRSEMAGTGIPHTGYTLSEFNLGSKVRGICFYAVTAVTAIFLFVLMLVAHPFVLLFDRYQRKAHHLIAKIWATLTVTPFFNVKFEGLENLPPPSTPAVYVSNHQSFVDIYALLTLGTSFKFISKTEIFLYPIIGWAMFILGFIPLKRMDNRSQLDCLKRCMDLVRKGASVLFFPEGTRSENGKLGVFKKGAFSVAAKVKVPVVPITLLGTGNIMAAGMEGIVNPGTVKVVIHKPIEGSDPDALCQEARNIIADVI